jgi:predicted Zn finger-like uncharacterized protein
MRIVCPGCAAEYEVPSSKLQPHRKVRCARCNADWVPVQDAATAAPDDGPVAEAEAAMRAGDTAMDRLAAAAPARPSGALRAAWAVTVLALAGSAAAAFTWRSQVTQVWPASAWVLGVVDRVMPGTPPPLHAEVKPEKSRD